MTNSTKTVLTLAVAFIACAPSAQAGGYRRGSYGGGYRSVSSPAGTRAAGHGYQNGGGVSSHKSVGSISAYQDSTGSAQVRGRSSVGYGQTTAGYGAAAGYARALNGRGFGSSQSLFAGTSIRSFGTRYAEAPAGGGTGGAAPTPDPAPVQGFAVPGALIRTAGLEHYYNEPSQPAREFAVPAGRIAVQDNLAYQETYHKGAYQIQPDKTPPPNPGSGGRASGGNGATPNSELVGVDGQVFGGGH